MLFLGFTGIDSAYEPPSEGEADLVIDAGTNTVDQCVQQLIKLLVKKVLLKTFELDCSLQGALKFVISLQFSSQIKRTKLQFLLDILWLP